MVASAAEAFNTPRLEYVLSRRRNLPDCGPANQGYLRRSRRWRGRVARLSDRVSDTAAVEKAIPRDSSGEVHLVERVEWQGPDRPQRHGQSVGIAGCHV